MNILSDISAVCFGLILGSFFNVLIWRIPRGESIAWPGSHCPQCSRAIRPWENIPVLSFLLLRGKCAGCGMRISLQYPLVELATGICSVLLWVMYVRPVFVAAASPWQMAITVFMAFTLLLMIPVTVIDYLHYIIPDRFTLPGIIIGLAASFAPGGVTPLDSLIGIAMGGGMLLAVGKLGEILFKKDEAMGGGDIKLMAFVGALWGWKTALLTIMLGSLSGAAIGLALIPLKFLPKDHRIPFGPFLAAGLWVSVLAGGKLVEWYLDWTMRLIG